MTEPAFCASLLHSSKRVSTSNPRMERTDRLCLRRAPDTAHICIHSTYHFAGLRCLIGGVSRKSCRLRFKRCHTSFATLA